MPKPRDDQEALVQRPGKALPEAIAGFAAASFDPEVVQVRANILPVVGITETESMQYVSDALAQLSQEPLGKTTSAWAACVPTTNWAIKVSARKIERRVRRVFFIGPPLRTSSIAMLLYHRHLSCP